MRFAPFSLALITHFMDDGMVFSSIAAHDKYDIAVVDIYPVVCHCATTERLCQSRNSGGVSNPGLVVYINNPRTGPWL